MKSWWFQKTVLYRQLVVLSSWSSSNSVQISHCAASMHRIWTKVAGSTMTATDRSVCPSLTFPKIILPFLNSCVYSKSLAGPLSRSPIIRPNRPSTDEKISITRTLTNLDSVSHSAAMVYSLLSPTHKLGSAASARAALDPLMPTLIPHTKLQAPTKRPDQKSA